MFLKEDSHIKQNVLYKFVGTVRMKVPMTIAIRLISTTTTRVPAGILGILVTLDSNLLSTTKIAKSITIGVIMQTIVKKTCSEASSDYLIDEIVKSDPHDVSHE